MKGNSASNHQNDGILSKFFGKVSRAYNAIKDGIEEEILRCDEEVQENIRLFEERKKLKELEQAQIALQKNEFLASRNKFEETEYKTRKEFETSALTALHHLFAPFLTYCDARKKLNNTVLDQNIMINAFFSASKTVTLEKTNSLKKLAEEEGWDVVPKNDEPSSLFIKPK